jgi:hypothetical protein
MRLVTLSVEHAGVKPAATPYFLATTIHSLGEGKPSPSAPSHYFFATTIVLTVAVTPSTTSTTTM